MTLLFSLNQSSAVDSSKPLTQGAWDKNVKWNLRLETFISVLSFWNLIKERYSILQAEEPFIFIINETSNSNHSRNRECAQSCLTLCDPMDCSLPGSSVRGVLQARILEWVAISSSRASSQPTSPASPELQVDSPPLNHLGSPWIENTDWLLLCARYYLMWQPCEVHVLIPICTGEGTKAPEFMRRRDRIPYQGAWYQVPALNPLCSSTFPAL